MNLYNVRWMERARRNFNHILDWYTENAGEFVAHTIYERIVEQVDKLKTFPERARPGRVPGTREYVLSHVPYIAIIAVEGQEVRILNLMHMKQKYPRTDNS
ncbi:MAG: type II toxin-antitoxin system RelE/ParE family toxin [Azoarcus sp.]|jgi:toxin ParE1/3/4|nr:type II toxin-antitoxin system RelE/ParE family toxin [Azoarcus sp.]